MAAGCSLLWVPGLGARLAFPQAWTWCDSILTSATEFCAGILQRASTAATPAPKRCQDLAWGAEEHCTELELQSERPALQRQLLPTSPACAPSSAALPSTPASAERRRPLCDLELAGQDAWHRGPAAVQMHQDEGADTVPGHGTGGKLDQGKLPKVLFQLKGRKKCTPSFCSVFFSLR